MYFGFATLLQRAFVPCACALVHRSGMCMCMHMHVCMCHIVSRCLESVGSRWPICSAIRDREDLQPRQVALVRHNVSRLCAACRMLPCCLIFLPAPTGAGYGTTWSMEVHAHEINQKHVPFKLYPRSPSATREQTKSAGAHAPRTGRDYERGETKRACPLDP
jgi:hypothetical protein